jgi:hypothetical protein
MVVTAFQQLMAERPDLHEHGKHRISSEHIDHELDNPPFDEQTAA